MKNLSRIWIIFPPLLLTGLFISTDADVNGIQGLTAPGVLLPWIVLTVPLIIFAWAVQRVYTSRRFKKLLAAVLGFSALASIFITLLGTTAKTVLTVAWSCLGVFLLFSFTLILTVTPAILARHASGSDRMVRKS